MVQMTAKTLRTGVLERNLRNELRGAGMLRDAKSNAIDVSHVSLSGVSFRSPIALTPGQVHQLSSKAGGAALESRVRVISTRLRPDGLYDVTAEFF